MTLKTTFGLTFENNNVSKSAHIPNVFKKLLGMLKSECIPNVLKSQRIYAIKGLDLKSVPIYLSHRLMEQAQPQMVDLSPQAEDIKIQLAQSEKVKTIQLTSLAKVKHLQTFAQIEFFENIKYLRLIRLPPMGDSENIKYLGRIAPFIDSDKIINLTPYPFINRASPQIEEKGYPPMTEKSFTPLGEMSANKTIANLRRCHYPSCALSKILKLAVEGYNLQGVQSVRAFFVRNISMRSHIVMARLERDASERTGNLVDLSSNPFQLCHPHLEVKGKAPKLQGVHNCA